MKPIHYLIALVLSLLIYIQYQDHMYIKSFQSGERTLTCHMDDGIKVIEPSKIVSVDFETNTFVFTNGSASSCEVSK